MLTYSANHNSLIEASYEMKEEARNAALFTTGNGYFGIRGSFEEFGSLNVQGAYIRGLIDEIIEIPQIYIDNMYMRKYYINEIEAKQFETQDSCINFADILLLRFTIGGHTFYPWEGKIESWVRYIDTNDGCLIREVVWNDLEGHLTKLSFRRFASFKDNHHYFIHATLEKLNHNLDVVIDSGLDTFIKTNGQKKSKLKSFDYDQGQFLFGIGEKYHFETAISIHNEVEKESSEWMYDTGCHFERIHPKQEKVIHIKKAIVVHMTQDVLLKSELASVNHQAMREVKEQPHSSHYQKHLIAYVQAFTRMNIELDHKEDEALLQYANYQTLISLDRYDQVHSVSAKNLTGEKYNQFVWWDAEIFQFPVYLMTQPEAAKSILMYRYNRLEEAVKNAKKEGIDGARYAFCSSVLGDEKVWAYARHPFMQIHINSDIAYAILAYYRVTKDHEFMVNYGVEMLLEISKYFIQRVQYNENEDIYDLNNVTGTDEHHPYINNNAYTNFMVSYVLGETVEWLRNKVLKDKYGIQKPLLDKIKQVSLKIKKSITKDGYIPQFDGYFNLKETLEVTGNGSAKSFQMKQSGLYHESQVIKQPDVIMLFTYIDLPLGPVSYERNWQYYEKMCEASSSLTYPVHAIAAIDHQECDKFYDYWYKSVAIDIIDHHKEAHLGLHAACMAGGWYSVFRGLFGFKPALNYLELNPTYFERWGNVKMEFMYQGKLVKAELSKESVTIYCTSPLRLVYKQQTFEHTKKTIIPLTGMRKDQI
ncbi:hypothetical protein N7603_00510 [Acholeplasma vituli]|uniref:Kojibiose phosphorylase n=1 Tax=Paracholeplasma vituli TaxID=69473 RepID=A0ABT2PT69_9MOLU|nr:hypothetical protein [Paracholeplasma vituli]MCU0104142.1 hypothetical protein [Paracholeplasma vituli]